MAAADTSTGGEDSTSRGVWVPVSAVGSLFLVAVFGFQRSGLHEMDERVHAVASSYEARLVRLETQLPALEQSIRDLNAAARGLQAEVAGLRTDLARLDERRDRP